MADHGFAPFQPRVQFNCTQCSACRRSGCVSSGGGRGGRRFLSPLLFSPRHFSYLKKNFRALRRTRRSKPEITAAAGVDPRPGGARRLLWSCVCSVASRTPGHCAPMQKPGVFVQSPWRLAAFLTIHSLRRDTVWSMSAALAGGFAGKDQPGSNRDPSTGRFVKSGRPQQTRRSVKWRRT